MACLKQGFWEVRHMKKIKKEVTNLWKKETKNTNLDQNSTHKSSKKPIFIVRKWPPRKVDKLITFEVAKLITLERPKGGQTNNSPAWIYIYMLGSRMRAHIRPLQTSQFGAPKIPPKRLLSAERRPLSDGPGSHRATVRGPPKIAPNGDWMWSLNRLLCGPRTGFQIGHFVFLLPSFCLKSVFL